MATAGMLAVTVEHAQGLRLRHWRHSLYCVISIGAQAFRTKISLNGGRDPVWNATFQFHLTSEDCLEIEIKDSETRRNGGHVAQTQIPLATVLRSDRQQHIRTPVFVERVLGLQLPHGCISLALVWSPCSAAAATASTSPHVVAYGMPALGQPVVVMPQVSQCSEKPTSCNNGSNSGNGDGGHGVCVGVPVLPQNAPAGPKPYSALDDAFSGGVLHLALFPVRAAIRAERRAVRAASRGLVQALRGPVEAAVASRH